MTVPLGGLVSFNLRKFSYVTTTSLNGPFPWSHLSPPELAVTFEEVVVLGGVAGATSRAIRVHQGAQCLETIFVDTLLQQFHEDNLSASARHLPDKARKALIRENRPAVAVRYLLPDRISFRRIQLNFLLESDFDQAVHLLHECGLPVQHKPIDSSETVAGSEIGLMRPSSRPAVPSRPISRGDSLHLRGDSVSAYQPSQSGSYGHRPSSQTSQWMHQGYQDRPRPIYGPSLIESTASYQLHPEQSTYQAGHGSIYAQQMQHPTSRPGSVLSRFRYNSESQHPSQPTGADPLRRSLFSDPHDTPEPFIRPNSAATWSNAVGAMCPPKRDLPFSRPPSRPVTSTSNRLAEPPITTGAVPYPPAPEPRLPTYQNPAASSNPFKPPEKIIRAKTETALQSDFWDKASMPSVDRILPPAPPVTKRPYTRSVAASVIVEDEPPKKKTKPTYTRPSTAKSAAAKSAAVKAKQPAIVVASNTKSTAAKAVAKKSSAIAEAEISTDSGRETTELLSTRQAKKLTAGPVEPKRPPAKASAIDRNKTAPKTAPSQAAPAKKSAASKPPTAPTKTTPPKPAVTEAKATKPAAPKRARTPAPKKAAITYTSVGIQTTPPAEPSRQFADIGTCTDLPSLEDAAAQVPAHTATSTISPSRLDVSLQWQNLVEAFVLRHRDRILARPSGARIPIRAEPPNLATADEGEGPFTPTLHADALPRASNDDADDDTIANDDALLERSVAASIMEPGFEDICRDVERACESLDQQQEAVRPT